MDLTQKINAQVKYITNVNSCAILDCTRNKIDKISTHIVKDILENNFHNAPDMDAVICMFNNLLLSTTKSKQNGIFHLSEQATQWIVDLEKIDVDSTSGFIYFSNILSDIKVIIKFPQYINNDNEIIREYFIGMVSINKLRYIIPNFVYTFGVFICPMNKDIICKKQKNSKNTPFVIYESIQGKNMQKMFEKNQLTFTQYLGMFIQILIALEVAQRETSFTHFDFHTANLMCRPIKNDYNYLVPLDNMVYEVTAKEYLPTIIDFGLSTVKYDGTPIGSYTFPEYGMMNYMLPGVDMFKFLYSSIAFSEGNLQRQIMNLLAFYGKEDPYKFLIKGDNAINKAGNEYAKKGSYSRVTTYTPLEFLNWILEQPEYYDITSIYIKKIDRNINVPLTFSTIVQTYDDKEKAIHLIEKYIKSNSSYIMSKYYIYILKEYNQKLASDKLKSDIIKMNTHITKSRKKLIQTDYITLMEYKNIPIPDIIKIYDDSKRILNIKINSKKLKTQKNQVLRLIERYFSNISFFTNILPYLQFMYTIKEMKLVKVYAKFLSSFISSQQYKIYTQHNISVNKTQRWCNSLIDSYY